MTTNSEACNLELSSRCEICLGRMEERLITYEGKEIKVLQCVRCRFFERIE
ncbi:MAG: hypothetical protein ACTSRA_08405 [Promethearchaeota archaeon]